MNRFRQLKDKLIKSKRDSQKLQQCPFSQNELQDWVEKQLEYYGISKDSYRLRELRNLSESKSNGQEGSKLNHLQGTTKPNPEHQSSNDTVGDSQNKNHPFAKKILAFTSTSNFNNFNSPIISAQQVSSTSKLSKQPESNQSNNESSSQPSSKRLICKKPKNYHVSSMNDAQKIVQTQEKDRSNQNQTQKETKNMFKSCQPQENQNKTFSPQKQLDYYTLILQLTAELNYSRVNKEISNEKSILNQIKNLISFIEGQSATEPGTQPSAEQISNAKVNLNSQQSHQYTNIKSNHTFSSVFSNESIANQIDHEKSVGSSEKRKIKYKLIEKQSLEENLTPNHRVPTEPISSQRNDPQDEHNDTFQSINAFEENDCSSEEEDKTSIIDMVNDQECHEYRDDIFIQESDEHNESVAKENLFMITERQSEYSSSANPSIHVSPNKYTCEKSLKSSVTLDGNILPHAMEKHIEALYADNIFKKKASEKELFGKSLKMLPENEIILKKLSDRFENSEDPIHLFQQSIEYKRILYMLDSEYGSSDYKNRTFSSLFGQKSSSIGNQGGSDKQSYQYSMKGASQESAKSFARQIFESDGSYTKQNHTQLSPCLMSKLDNLFKADCQKESKSPKLLHFSSENQLDSKGKENQINLTKNHKRSQTMKDPFSNKPMQKTIKYKFNVLSELSQQIHEESEENPFDNNKYEPILRTEYNDDESVYHKVSRHSYLTSSSAQNSNEPTSSEGECMDGNKKIMKKGALIVKKNKKSDKLQKQEKQNFESSVVKSSDEEKFQKSMKFIVKKNPDQKKCQKNSQDDFLEELSNNCSDLFSKRPDTQEVIFISMSDEPTARVETQRLEKSVGKYKKSCESSQSSNEKPDEEKPCLNNKIRSPSLNESKVSINSSNRPIKYKVYAGLNESQVVQEKQDKRKVLKDIVSVLNSKYNRNIKLKE